MAQELIAGLQRSEERSSAISDALIEHIRRPQTTVLAVDDNSISMVDGDSKTTISTAGE